MSIEEQKEWREDEADGLIDTAWRERAVMLEHTVNIIARDCIEIGVEEFLRAAEENDGPHRKLLGAVVTVLTLCADVLPAEQAEVCVGYAEAMLVMKPGELRQKMGGHRDLTCREEHLLRLKDGIPILRTACQMLSLAMRAQAAAGKAKGRGADDGTE